MIWAQIIRLMFLFIGAFISGFVIIYAIIVIGRATRWGTPLFSDIANVISVVGVGLTLAAALLGVGLGIWQSRKSLDPNEPVDTDASVYIPTTWKDTEEEEATQRQMLTAAQRDLTTAATHRAEEAAHKAVEAASRVSEAAAEQRLAELEVAQNAIAAAHRALEAARREAEVEAAQRVAKVEAAVRVVKEANEAVETAQRVARSTDQGDLTN